MKLNKYILMAALFGLGATTGCTQEGATDDPVKPSSGKDGKTDVDTKTDADTDAKTDIDTKTDDDTEVDDDPGVEDNIIENGSFEQWGEVEVVSHKNSDSFTDVAMMPLKWNGSKSKAYNGNVNGNGNALYVYDYTDAAHDGSHALQASRISTDLERFTTVAKTVWKGDYKCSVWVRGQGTVSLGYIRADSSAVNSYSPKEVITSPNEWKLLRHNFNISSKINDFEFVLRTGSTIGEDHIQFDDVVCTRKAMPCDNNNCDDSWQICQDISATEFKCIAKNGSCEADADCGVSYKACQTGTHTCVVKTGLCGTDSDCDRSKDELCDLSSNSCYVGLYCDSHTCEDYQECSNEKKICALREGACFTSKDCIWEADKPVCDIANHACVGMDSTVNVVKYIGESEDGTTEIVSGTFEYEENKPSYVDSDGIGRNYRDVPAGWMALQAYYGYYMPESKIAGENVTVYSERSHSGDSCMQIKETSSQSERLTSEAFKVVPGKSYTCTYYVSGKGQYRHRTYCKAWGKDTQFATVDSDSEWTQVNFNIKSNSEECMIIFYVSNTEADEHVLIDDLSCSPTY